MVSVTRKGKLALLLAERNNALINLDPLRLALRILVLAFGDDLDRFPFAHERIAGIVLLAPLRVVSHAERDHDHQPEQVADGEAEHGARFRCSVLLWR